MIMDEIEIPLWLVIAVVVGVPALIVAAVIMTAPASVPNPNFNLTVLNDTSKKANVTDGCLEMFLERRAGGSETRNYYLTNCSSTYEVLSTMTQFDGQPPYDPSTLTFTPFENECILQNQNKAYGVNVRICP